jgi:hypothetical protein
MYNPKIWYDGDIVTSGGLNNIEQGIAQNAHDIEDLQGALDGDLESYVDSWLDSHPEATTTVQDGAITSAKLANGAVTNEKLTARLKILTNIDLNGIAYHDNVILPIAKSYVEAVTYLSGYYYAVCRDYSVTPNTCFVAKYDTSYNLIDTIYTSPTYGMANNIFNDGERIHIDYDSGYHVSFDTSISDDFAVQNSNIRNMAFWDDTLYGIVINASDVTVYTVASDFTTISELFSIATIRQTLQSASIIDGILYIPTTKGLFKFIDMQTQQIIAEIPYYDSKEIENFFKDKDGTVKCSGHFYGMNGVFNIGAFSGGVDGAKMQYSGVDGSVGDFKLVASHRYGFYNITNGTSMGLPVDTCDLFVYENAKILISDQGNCIYIYKDNQFRLIGLISPIDIYYKVDTTHDIHFRLDTDGHFYVYTGIIVLTSNTLELTVDLSELYTKLGLSDGWSKQFIALGSTVGATNIGNTADVYAVNVVVQKTKAMFRCRNLTQNTTSNINAKFEFYERIY